jgi:lipopolysaccharide export LptBFGC system permease protein LptF
MLLMYSRYLLRVFLSRFFLMLFLFFFFYILIDFALNIRINLNHIKDALAIFYHYTLEIFLKLDLLLPLCFLLSMILTLHNLNMGFELIAFQALGISKKALLKPIWVFSWGITLFLFFNFQTLIPWAKAKTKTQLQAIKNKPKKPLKKAIFQQTLEDDSFLIYSKWDEYKEAFYDVYWIKQDSVWHFETLNFSEGKMRGYEAFKFVRLENNGFAMQAHEKEIYLFEMPIITHEIKKEPLSFEFLSFTQLLISQISQFEKQTLVYNQIQSRFWQKFAIPFFSPLLFLLFSRSCLNFNRMKRASKLISVGLFIFVLFFTFLNALAILSEHNLIAPQIAAFGPFVLFGIFGIYQYQRP